MKRPFLYPADPRQACGVSQIPDVLPHSASDNTLATHNKRCKNEEDAMSNLIVTGIENVPDRSSRTGWSQRAYARKVSSIDKIEDKESIWSGELRWTDGDPEGRFDAGWMGPHGLILSDRQHELALGAARADLRR